MFSRLHPAWLAFGGSVLLLAALVGLLVWGPFGEEHSSSGQPLVVHCAEALRVPMTAIAREYEAEFGQKVYLQLGPSQTILASLEVTRQGDVFLPADDSYIAMASEKQLLRTVSPLATMQAVLVVRAGLERPITTWQDLLSDGLKVGIANPEAAAITKLSRAKLDTPLWTGLEKHGPKYLGNVNDVASAVRIGSVDVGLVWDVVAKQHPSLTVVRLPELEPVVAQVQVAVTAFSKQPDDALRLVRYMRTRGKGVPHFEKQGFSNVAEVADARGVLILFAGAMLRPAIEATLDDFEKVENVRVTRVYDGCGVLVSAMHTGKQPDVYFACDPRFMEMVREKFDEPTTVSSNQLVIAVHKGNPHGVRELRDLGKPGLHVGVGHEHQCALGTLTKESFVRTGTYAAVVKNVVLQSTTGDTLVNQLRTGTGSDQPSLDAAVVYRSNVTPFLDTLDMIPVTGVPCATPQQPVAVSKGSPNADAGRRLVDMVRSAESRQRFEQLGFGWDRR